MASNSSISLIKEVLTTVEKLGIEKTTDVIRQARRDIGGNHHLKELILEQCCTHYNIKKPELFKGRKNNNRTDALTLCYVLFKKYFNHNQKEIADYFHKDFTNVSKRMTEFKLLNDKIKQDREMKAIYKAIDKRIVEFLNNK